MRIEIHIPRPGITLLAIAAVSGWAVVLTSGTPAAPVNAPVGSVIEGHPVGPVTGVERGIAAAGAVVDDARPHQAAAPSPLAVAAQSSLTPAEMRMKWARARQQFLSDRENIVRLQLQSLQRERESLGESIDPVLEEQFRQSVKLLTSLAQDREAAERFLESAYRQLWEAEERAMAISEEQEPAIAPITLQWPVEPALGISAPFLGKEYEDQFHLKHYGMDIPVAQGTDVLAAAAGVVKIVVDHGYGVSYVLIESDGFTAAYLHLSQITVRPGERVQVGSVIGKSGGRSGTKGAGFSTGPHLHFAIYIDGVPVDPMSYLPEYRG